MGQFDGFRGARSPFLWMALAAALAAVARPAAAQTPPPPSSDLAAEPAEDPLENVLDLDLEQLSQAAVSVSVPSMDTVVSTVSRQESTVGRTPAAVYVMTQEMIQRSGANNVPDLLRLVPGIHVARIDANKWMITSRGFNARVADKLLVQIDGRSVYNQVFGGVYWSMHDLVLEDIERIEVIRGPGGTVWGANAVNGVINIITKRAADTQGLLATGGTGTEERGFGTVRYGGQASRDLHWRAYGKFKEVDSGFDPNGNEYDDWRQSRTGFRADWQATPDDTVTFQGDYFEGVQGWHSLWSNPPYQTGPYEDVPNRGLNGLMRWTHTVDDDTESQWLAYYDYWNLKEPTATREQERTIHVDFQQRWRWGHRHNMIAGAGYRNISSIVTLPPLSGIADPSHVRVNLYSAFVQDEITLDEDRWYLTLGSKFEQNDFTGFEIQPSVRLLFLPSERESMWWSVSRAVGTPTLVDQFYAVNFFQSSIGPTYSRLVPNSNLPAEDLLAIEWGYRQQPTDEFSWDLACFYNRYDDVMSYEMGAPFFDPGLGANVIPMISATGFSADTYGVELTSTVDLTDTWRVSGGYTCLQLNVHTPPTDMTEGSSPRNQLFLRSAWTPSQHWHIDTYLRYVDSMALVGIPSYTTADARIAWRPNPHFEWAVVGRNLFDPHHPEANDTFAGVYGTEVQREMFTTLTWKR